jgi:hypothetical protein
LSHARTWAGLLACVAIVGELSGPLPPASAQARVPLAWYANPRLVANADGVPQPAGRPADVPDGKYEGRLAVSPALCRGDATYTWTVEGKTGRPQRGCSVAHEFMTQGRHRVAVSISRAGSTRMFVVDVLVRDWLIASVGDSVGSGEGNPEVPGFVDAEWRSRQCHRSGRAASAQAGLELEQEYDDTSVSMLHVACSGASIEKGLLGAYPGIEEGPALDEQVSELLGVPRPLDAVIVNIGANDVYFGDVAVFCIRHRHCYDQPFRAKDAPQGTPKRPLDEVVRDRLDALPALYAKLEEALRGIVPPSHVVLVDYFDPTHDARGRYCKRIGPHGFNISSDEARWAHDDLLVPLNAAIHDAVTEHRWTEVTGVAEAFAHHGYCAGRASWIVRILQSLRHLGGERGSLFQVLLHPGVRLKARLAGVLHPNELGHAEIAKLEVAKLRSLLVGSPPPPGGGKARGPGGGDDGSGAETPAALTLGGLGLASGAGFLIPWLVRRRRGTAGPRPATRTSAILAPPSRPNRTEPTRDARQLLLTLLTGGDWIHRRVESIELLDEATVRHRVSVDFTLAGGASDGVLPLGLARKGEQLADFHLRDERGRPVPRLNAPETAEVVAGLLARLVDRALGGDGAAQLEPALREIATSPPAAAREALRRIGGLLPPPLAARLEDDSVFGRVAATLADAVPVLAVVGGPPGRRVLKLAYDVPVLARSGWLTRSLRVELPLLGDAPSHHFEVRRPHGLEVLEARLAVYDADGKERASAGQRGVAPDAHLHVANAPAGSRGVASVRLRARRAGILRSGPVFGAATAATLTAAWFALPQLATDAAGVAAVLLALPAALGAYLSSRPEHDLARRLLRLPRALAIASSVLAFVAAGAVALQPSVLALRWALGVPAALAWLVAAALVAAALLPRARDARDGPRRRWRRRAAPTDR